MSIQAQILNLLMDLQERTQMAMLLISHNLLVVRHVSTRLAVMYGGRVIEAGRSEDLYAAPKHPYTQALLSAVPVANPKAERGAQTGTSVWRSPRPSPIAEAAARSTPGAGWPSTDAGQRGRPLRPVGAPGQVVACHLAS